MVRLARKAEASGFESLWVAETRITRDAVVPMAAIAAATERVRLGTAILNVFTRSPVVIGITFVSLDELAPGRIVMGLGAGSPLVLAPQGQPFTRPLTRLREYVEVLRPLMRGETVTYAGKTIELDGARIEDLLAGDSQIASDATAIPLYLGVTGAPALDLAGEAGDGVLLNVCLGTDYVTRARGLIEQGALPCGPRFSAIEIGLMLVVSPDADSQSWQGSRAAFRRALPLALPEHRKRDRVPAEWLDRLRQTFHEAGVEEAARLVDDATVDALTAAGTPDECHARIDEYRRAGVDLPVMVALDGAIDQTIDLLGPASS